MQPILATDPYHVDLASQTGRLHLTRTKGSLSGGTRVKLVSANYERDVFVVAATIREQVNTVPYFKSVTLEVTVTLDDLVIRRMSQHPDVLNVNQPKSRRERRAEIAAVQKVLDDLKGRSTTQTGGSNAA